MAERNPILNLYIDSNNYYSIINYSEPPGCHLPLLDPTATIIYAINLFVITKKFIQ
jgi:hypothetical protein